jgi:peptidyl-tRNA hydrolase
MLNTDNESKLKDILNMLETNFQRLNFAFSRTEMLLPVSRSILQNLEPEQISFIEQYIFRFAKIQDIMGEKLFRMKPFVVRYLMPDT